MFVKNNSSNVVFEYFYSKLNDIFSQREIRQITKQVILKRCNWDESQWILNKNHTFSESDLLYFRSVLKDLLNGKPFQYILKESYFYNLTLKVDERALIPRPETEELVDLIIKENKEENLKVLDIGTGTGCIPLALKNANNSWEISAFDVDEAAVQLAKENATLNQLAIHIEKLDILNESNWKFCDGESFDVIVSNPPYILKEEADNMAKHVVEFEPHIALFVENDPLIFYRKIAEFAKKYLKQGGKLYFEVHENYAKDVYQLLDTYHFKNICIFKDLQGKDRMISAIN